MSKRVIRHWDDSRTALLGYDELLIQRGRGDNRYFYGWNQDMDVPCCPKCGEAAIKVHDLFSKKYRDLVIENGQKRVIWLEYEFYKYRCLNSECRHIFAKEIGFASRSDNVTYRLENEIARLVILGNSYDMVAAHLQDTISRQAIGQIFNRWVRRMDEQRRFQQTPSYIAILSGRTDKDRYSAFLSLDDGIRIIEIIFGISSADIVAVARKIGTANVKTVICDCDPVIVGAVKDLYPSAIHIIPIEYWFKLVTDDFSEYAHDKLKWCPVSNKDSLIIQAKSELGMRIGDLQRILEMRPSIRKPYEDYNRLRDIITRRDELWVFDEITEWIESIEEDFRDELSVTIFQLYLYQNEIKTHEENRELVPERLFYLTGRLNELILKMRVFSDEFLKAKVLYSTEADLQNWCGIPIEDVIERLTEKNEQEAPEDLKDDY